MAQVSFLSCDKLLNQKAPLSLALLCHGVDFTQEKMFQRLDSLTGSALSRACRLRGFSGKAGEKLGFLVPALPGVKEGVDLVLAQIQLIGCGEEDGDSDGNQASAWGGAAFHALSEEKLEGTEAAILVPESLTDQIVRIALGACLKSYRFDHYHTERKKKRLFTNLRFVAVDGDVAEKAGAAWPAQGESVCDGVFLARDLVSEPANILTPEKYRERIEALRHLGLDVEVLDTARMKELGFGALLGVAQGSAEPPYTVIMRHNGADQGETAPLAFVGKGVTFDTGGISIKPAAGMDEMKTDMGGSAVVVGLMSLLARRKAKINAVGVVGLVENMPSGTAQRPGDIVTSYSGQTIEVLNTDAEGRLVLADLLAYTSQTCKPEVMINLATLTGAIVVALGEEYAGLFSNNDELAEALTTAGAQVDEKLWRMPMGPAYNRHIDSPVADMKNIGGRPGSSILAAEFLKRFVGKTPWAHLDIAGTAWKEKSSACAPKGATGYGVRLLNAFIEAREAGK